MAEDAVETILTDNKNARLLYVFAHGAGAGMRHPFMQQMSEVLSSLGVATLRYQFPYMQIGGKRPDPPAVLEATVRAAIARAAEIAAGRTVIAGGKSMGGRMTSQALAKQPDERVAGLAFTGFPLHQPGKPGIARADHLKDVKVPMLFLQGTRDSLADLEMMKQVTSALPLATLHIIDGADHGFAVPKRTGRTSGDVYNELGEAIVAWAATIRESVDADPKAG